ncbi:MAG: hypothetical protein CMP42_02545 [Rickettsiales bacterium]|nr:hypothetical protein [Rickettsiales bacterium]MAT32823.1 hypothetical protein [Rickettsiales bacterium]|tara:strand:+ start:34 stop:675 length:642 start_codon:yes stop_codon:yes gene_type:complete
MSEEFIKEVDEDLKEEKRVKLWKKLLPYVLGFSFGVILLTSSFVFWENYTKNTNQSLGDDFTAAVGLASEDDIDAALLALDRIVDKGSDGYATIAKMKKASILIQKGDLEKGLAIYLDLERNAVDQSFRDIATILYVLNSMDKEDPLILLEKVKPLEASKIWKSSALELKAFIYLKTEKKEQAKETFQSILDQKNTPSSLSTRARNMIEYLKE